MVRISDTNKYTFNPMTTKYSEGLTPLPKPIYCDYDKCRCLIPQGGSFSFVVEKTKIVKRYCNEWCKEMDVNSKKVFHRCKECGETVEPFMRKTIRKGKVYTFSSGVYPNYCEKHKKQWNGKKEK